MSSASLIEKCCLLAYPVAGNPTHYMVEQALAAMGLDWRFMTFEVPPERFGDAMRGIRALGFRGVKIAEPHQHAVLEYLDDTSEEARLSGSVNTVLCSDDALRGDNTEGAALVQLVREGLHLAGQRVMIVGAGRMARVAAIALATAGAKSITLACRSQDQGQALAELIKNKTSAEASLVVLGSQPIGIEPSVAVLVNATSLGAVNPQAPLPLDVGSLAAPLVVVDVDYQSSGTSLTRQAAAAGCRVIRGIELYVKQTALAMQAWTGTEPDTAAMREAAEEYLGV